MQTLNCDSCEQPIVDMNNRVQVLVFTSAPIADPQLDLCADCGKDVIDSALVKRGQEKALERILASIPQTEPVPSITEDPSDTTEAQD